MTCAAQRKACQQTFYVATPCCADPGVVRTRAEPFAIEVQVGPARPPRSDCFGVLLQYPAANGDVDDYRALVRAVHARGGLVVVAADLLALALLFPPGEWGADVVVGSRSASACRWLRRSARGLLLRQDELKRNMPGACRCDAGQPGQSGL